MEKEVPAEVVNAVKDIPISHVERTDQLVWHFNSNGSYSVKSGYHVAHQDLMEGGHSKPSPSFKLGKDFWKVLWKMKVPNKIKKIWWRTCLDILATKGNLFKRKCAKENVCPICDSGEESINHMLFSCPSANLVWFGCNIKPLGDLGGNSTVAKWAADMIEKLGSKDGMEFMGRVATITWNIWKGRNDYVFKRAMVNPQKTITSIRHAEMECVDTLVITTVHKDNPLVQEEVSTWRAPDFGKFKTNCDVAISIIKNASKAVVILRNWRGKLVGGAAKTVSVCSNLGLGGELFAIRAACEMLFRLGMKEVVVESDNKQAITLSVSELVPPWNVRALVLDIRQYAKEGAFLFKWVCRSANKVAHEVASLALRSSLPCNWISNPPLSLVSVLNLANESQ